jgi:hypothetical protein
MRGVCHITSAGVTDPPAAVPLREDLASLLAEPFRARTGCYRTGAAAGVYVAGASGTKPGLVDLFVSFFPRTKPSPATAEEQQFSNMELDTCLKLLRLRRPETRVSSCMRLASLGRAEAAEALLELARGDGDDRVREAAAAALESLSIPPLRAAALNSIALTLACESAFTRFEDITTRTDGRGHARFAGIPEDASCSLRLEGPADDALVSAEFTPDSTLSCQALFFNHNRPSRGRLGDFAVEIVPDQGASRDSFDAVLRFSRQQAVRAGPGAVPFRPLARRGQHVYHPAADGGAEGVLTFCCLPTGAYDLVWLIRPPLAAITPGLRGESKSPASPRDPSLGASLRFVVHPADARLLATVEPDRAGCVVVTVAADAAQLQGALVNFTLLEESGAIQLKDVTGSGVCRGFHYLRQRFTPESALALSLEVARENVIPPAGDLH